MSTVTATPTATEQPYRGGKPGRAVLTPGERLRTAEPAARTGGEHQPDRSVLHGGEPCVDDGVGANRDR